MTTLSVDKPRPFELGDTARHPVIADDIIYEGAAVGIADATGLARPPVAQDVFAGFAVRKCDNAGGAASAKQVEVRLFGIVELPIGSLAATNVGDACYASDDDTFTLSSSSTSFIGRVIRFVSSGVGVVAYDVRVRA